MWWLELENHALVTPNRFLNALLKDLARCFVLVFDADWVVAKTVHFVGSKLVQHFVEDLIGGALKVGQFF